MRAQALVSNLRRCGSAHSSAARTLSRSASSWASACRARRGPDARLLGTRAANAGDVGCDPWSERWTTSRGLRWPSAMLSASSTSWPRSPPVAQPTTRRETASATTARNTKPVRVGTPVMSATRGRSGASRWTSRSTRSQAGRALSARVVVRVPRRRPRAGDPGGSPQPPGALTPGAHARLAQRGRGRPPRAAGTMRRRVDRADRGRPLGVRHGAGRRGTITPGAARGSRETPSAALARGHGRAGLVRGRELEDLEDVARLERARPGACAASGHGPPHPSRGCRAPPSSPAHLAAQATPLLALGPGRGVGSGGVEPIRRARAPGGLRPAADGLRARAPTSRDSACTLRPARCRTTTRARNSGGWAGLVPGLSEHSFVRQRAPVRAEELHFHRSGAIGPQPQGHDVLPGSLTRSTLGGCAGSRPRRRLMGRRSGRDPRSVASALS